MYTLWHTRMMMWDGSKLWISIIMAVKKQQQTQKFSWGRTKHVFNCETAVLFLTTFYKTMEVHGPFVPISHSPLKIDFYATDRQHDTTRVLVPILNALCPLGSITPGKKISTPYNQIQHRRSNLNSIRKVDHTIENIGISDGCLDF